MDDRVIVLLGSSRKNSNTKKFVSNFFGQSGYSLIDLLDYTISPYNYEGVYPDSDQFGYIVNVLLNYNIIVFATPVYWYSMSGIMKTFFDRLTDLVTINKAAGRKLKGKSVRVLAVGTDAELPIGFEVPFKNTAEYLDMNFEGCIYQVTKD